MSYTHLAVIEREREWAPRGVFPKGHDFAQVTHVELALVLRLINNRPRKCLGWKSAHESFQQEVLHLA